MYYASVAEMGNTDSVEITPEPSPVQRKELKKVLVIDQSPLRRQCLVHTLLAHLTECRIESVATLEDAGAAADLILLNLASVGSTQEELQEYLGRVQRLFDRKPIVVLADANNLRLAKVAFRSGLKGYLPPSTTVDGLVAALRLCLSGGAYVPQELIELWTATADHQMPTRAEPAVSDVAVAPVTFGAGDDRTLTEREAQVVDCLRLGKPNKIIAYQLRISESTVKVHMRNIMRKLNATNRTQVAFIARGAPDMPRLSSAAPMTRRPDCAMSGEARTATPGDGANATGFAGTQVLDRSRVRLPECL